MASFAQMAAARSRRSARFTQKIQFFERQVMSGMRIGLRQRVNLAAMLLREKVVINISKPVGRGKPVQRSLPGEFPRADTTRLMKDIQHEVEEVQGNVVGRVSTSLDYGLILEVSPRLDRAYLLPTFRSMQDTIRRIITSPSPPFPGANQ